MDAKLQAQVRSLTREVGALREALRQEEKKRERLAAHAKAACDSQATAEAQVKQLTYVNTKLEQELRSVKERSDTASTKSRGSLESLKGKLGDVERSVHQRSVTAQQHVQRLHSLAQALQAAAMPLAIAAAAAAGPGAPASTSTATAAAAVMGLKSPLPAASRPAAAAAAQQRAKPEQLHRQFGQLFGGLSQLMALFSGEGSSNSRPEGCAVANPAPLLLTAHDGSTRAVHWQDQNKSANPSPGPSPAASPASARSLRGAAYPPATGAAAAAGPDPEKQRLVAEVHRLRATLAEARQRVVSSEAAAAAAAASSSSSGGGRVEAALQQLNAVVPQYRAAAQALQGQVTVLKEKLAVATRERAGLQEEIGKWRAAAQRHEAAFAETAAKLHAREAQSMAVDSEAQDRADQLHGEVAGLRRRCTELAGRLQESQRTVAQLQTTLSAKDKLAATQQQTIRELEGTVREQQADIRAALDLVSTRPAAAGIEADSYGLPGEEEPGAGFYDIAGWEDATPSVALACSAEAGGDMWDRLADDGGLSDDSWGFTGMDTQAPAAPAAAPAAELDGGSATLSSLLRAATAAADAATAWVGRLDDGLPAQADAWAAEDFGAAGADWSIPACGGGATQDSWLSQAAKQQPQQAAKQAPATTSLQAGIAGLEDALRSALDNLHV